MSQPLLRITYLSENRIERTSDDVSEVNRILETSQSNNASVGITGALIFNCGFFGQVLEGPQDQIETTFERIQLDPRHFNVRLLCCEPIGSRAFGGWSMGFVSAEAGPDAFFGCTSCKLLANPAHVSGDTLFAALHEVALRNELRPRMAA
jgi:blue light- and temperature-responsive anti-repressor